MKITFTLAIIVSCGIFATGQTDSTYSLERAKRAANEVPVIAQDVFVTFERYSDTTNPKDPTILPVAWFRLHNDSYLPVEIPTLDVKVLNSKCSSKRQNEPKVDGLCDNGEVDVMYRLENNDGSLLPGSDLGSTATLLPATSIIFSVPMKALNEGKGVTLNYVFLKYNDVRLEVYGKPVAIRFRGADIPKPSLLGPRSVLLPVTQAKTLTNQCSRPAPSNFSDTWEPDQAQIKEMESKQNEISKLEVRSCCIVGARVPDPEEWYRQYVGLIWHGRKIIYINGVSRGKPLYKSIKDGMVVADWTTEAVMVCDGGTAWGVIYDIATKTFSELAINGVA